MYVHVHAHVGMCGLYHTLSWGKHSISMNVFMYMYVYVWILHVLTHVYICIYMYIIVLVYLQQLYMAAFKKYVQVHVLHVHVYTCICSCTPTVAVYGCMYMYLQVYSCKHRSKKFLVKIIWMQGWTYIKYRSNTGLQNSVEDCPATKTWCKRETHEDYPTSVMRDQ